MRLSFLIFIRLALTAMRYSHVLTADRPRNLWEFLYSGDKGLVGGIFGVGLIVENAVGHVVNEAAVLLDHVLEAPTQSGWP